MCVCVSAGGGVNVDPRWQCLKMQIFLDLLDAPVASAARSAVY